jgi:hypothetical protein
MSLWKSLTGLINNTEFRTARIDASTHSLQIVDYSHHERHGGSAFFYMDSVELGLGGVQTYLITTPNTTKWSHFTFQGSGSAITQVDLYEGADRTGTTLQTVWNANRNSATAADTTIHKGHSGGSTDGTLIWTRKSGSATAQARTGNEGKHEQEIILKQNTKYIIRLTSSTAANLTNLMLDWYEHADKN